MKNLKITKHEKYRYYSQDEHGCFVSNDGLPSQAICRVYVRNDNNGNDNANAELIADAFNTANQCDLLPSELLQQRDELVEALKECVEGVKELNGEFQDGWDETINKSESLLTKIKTNA